MRTFRNLMSLAKIQTTRALRGVSIGAAMSLFVLGALSGTVFALTIPPTFAPRQFPSQQTHYLRFVVNFNSCNLPATAGSCNFKVGALPYNAFVARGFIQVPTAFNSTTTDTINIGTASGGAQLVSAQSTHTQINGTALTIVAANLGINATGNGIAQTGADGGFDVWVNVAYTGASPATTGTAVVVLEYFGANDGSCAYVPLGSTATPC